MCYLFILFHYFTYLSHFVRNMVNADHLDVGKYEPVYQLPSPMSLEVYYAVRSSDFLAWFSTVRRASCFTIPVFSGPGHALGRVLVHFSSAEKKVRWN